MENPVLEFDDEFFEDDAVYHAIRQGAYWAAAHTLEDPDAVHAVLVYVPRDGETGPVSPRARAVYEALTGSQIDYADIYHWLYEARRRRALFRGYCRRS